jgi:intracellular sulfur oxidation DsrE/DsrF family protein
MMKKTLSVLLLMLAISLPAVSSDKLNVVYHVSDAEKVSFVLNNIRNHIEGVGGPDKVHIVLVMHGPAVAAFNDIEAVDRVRGAVASLQEQGVAFNVCGNTLKVMDLTAEELLPGMIEVSQGGVTRIAELQSQGFVYIRP